MTFSYSESQDPRTFISGLGLGLPRLREFFSGLGFLDLWSRKSGLLDFLDLDFDFSGSEIFSGLGLLDLDFCTWTLQILRIISLYVQVQVVLCRVHAHKNKKL